jgi:putative DNA primase/helicase
MTKPTPDLTELCRRLHGMPAAMRERKQWLLWRFESYQGDKKPRKVPYYASGRKRAKAQGGDEDRAGLASFDTVLEQLQRGRYDGAGFAFLPGDGLIGIDIDGAIDPASGEVQERCQAIIDACASYTEHSPSGRGVHIIAAGDTQSFRLNNIGLEVYSGRQFFTCTGRHWAGTPTEVQPISEQTLRRLQATKASQRKPARAERPQAPGEPLSDFLRLNTMALVQLDAWVPVLFPTAQKQPGTGAWRVRSKDLGRDREEDLSLHRDGINDYGDEEGLTAIDVVVKFGGKTPREALAWLADALGVRLATPAKPRPAQPEPRADAAAAQAGEDPADPADPSEGEDKPAHWRTRLLRTDQGGVRDLRENVFEFMVNHPKLAGLVGYDEFAHVVKKLRRPPWDSPTGEWTTNDDYLLGHWLAQNEGFVVRNEATLVAGVAMAAFHARFNPLHDYINGLPQWDGIPRLAHWLNECLGAEDSTYTTLVGTWFIMGMVMRGLEPGCQMDYMVVLEGLQGKRKSTALRTLVGRDEWFADTPIQIGSKDALLSLAGKWLYEVGELDSFNRAEVTAVKQYVSSRADRVREPFARRTVDRPRSGVFGGTTNQSEYFKDPTGARRFWPVACDGEIDLEKLAQWRDQLYAEARARLQSDDFDTRRYYPTFEETERYLRPQQELREIVDPWFERISTWVNCRGNYGDAGLEVRDVESFSAFDLLTRALNVPADRIDGNRSMATRVGTIMHRLGWKKRRDATGERNYRYYRPRAAQAGQGGDTDATGGPDAQATSETEALCEV